MRFHRFLFPFSALAVSLLCGGCIHESEVYHREEQSYVIGDLGDDSASFEDVLPEFYYEAGISETRALSSNTSGISNDCITLVSHDVRLSKVLLYGVIPLNGVVSDFRLVIRFSTGEIETVELPFVIGGVLTQFRFELPSGAKSYSIEFCSYCGTSDSVIIHTGFDSSLSKVGDNTLHSKKDAVIFLFNGAGCCKDVIEVGRDGDYVSSFDIEYYGEVER